MKALSFGTETDKKKKKLNTERKTAVHAAQNSINGEVKNPFFYPEAKNYEDLMIKLKKCN